MLIAPKSDSHQRHEVRKEAIQSSLSDQSSTPFPANSIAAKDARENELFFILGCPRSGTTLLHVMLGRHPDIVVAPETKLFYYYNRLPNWLARRNVQRVEQDLGIDLECAQSGRLPATADLLQQVANAYRTKVDKPNARLFGEKTPEHSSRVQEIVRQLPNARFIVIHRDGRDVASSLARMPWIKCDLLSGMTLWKRYVHRLRKWRHDPRFIFVAYEDLVFEAEDTCRRILSHLNLDYDAAVADGSGDSCNAIPERELGWKELAASRPCSSRAYQWRENLDRATIERLESLAHRELEEYGYELLGRQPKATMNLRCNQAVSVAKMMASLPPKAILAEVMSYL